MSTAYKLKLPSFEGPLDLLLYLIMAHELDIFSINLEVLTYQYLDHLRLVKFKDLGEASSFMAMAASLCELKSRSLLPKENLGEAGDETLDEDDSLDALQNRLIQYDLFRQAGLFLATRGQAHGCSVTNSEWQRLMPLYEDIMAPLKAEPTTLVILYEYMLSTVAERRPVSVTAVKESITLEEVLAKIEQIVERLKFVLFQDMWPRIESRYELVAHILAALQMVRDRKLKMHQETDFGPLWLYPFEIADESIQEHVGGGEHGA